MPTLHQDQTPGEEGRSVESDRLGLEPCTATVVQDWADLVSQQGAVPFLHPGWVEAMCRAFFPSRPLHLVTVRRAQCLVGVVPVLIGRRTLLSPTTYASTPMFCPVATDAAARAGLIDGLLASSPGRLDLAFLPAQDPTADALCAAAGERGSPILRRTLQRSPFVDVSGDWGTYQERWSSSRAKLLRKKQRRLSRAGPVSFEMLDGTRDLDGLLSEALTVEAAGWKGSAGTAVLSSAPATSFYREVAQWAASRGLLRLAFLRAGVRPLAFSLLLEAGDRLYQLKAGYDPDEATCSPSTLLTMRLLEHAFRAPHLQTFEFLGKDEPYKLEFADHTRALVGVRVYTNRWTAGCELAVDHTAASAKDWVKERVPTAAWQRLSGFRAGLVSGLQERRGTTESALRRPRQGSVR